MRKPASILLTESCAVRRLSVFFVTSVLVLAGVIGSRADDRSESMAIIDKAIRAIGGETSLAKLNGMTWKSKGTYQFKGEVSYSNKDSAPEERFFSEYKETRGLKYASKLKWTTHYGGDVAVQEEERFEMQLHDKLDGSIFDQP